MIQRSNNKINLYYRIFTRKYSSELPPRDVEQYDIVIVGAGTFHNYAVIDQ